MTRDEKHEHRILTTSVDELTPTEFKERRAILTERRRESIKDELKRLAPLDMTRRHRRNAAHPKARNTKPSKYLEQQKLMAAALSGGVVGRIGGSRVIERIAA